MISLFHLRARQRGFTIIELIVVIVLIGILSAMAVARFMDRKDSDADAFTQTTKSMLRYAQKVAIAQNRAVYVRLDGATIALCFDSACTNGVVAPGGANSGTNTDKPGQPRGKCGGVTRDSWFCEAPADGIGYTVAPAATMFFFDEQGRPFEGTAAVNAATSAFLPTEISITGDTRAHIVTIESDTGYVH
jgi:MSHA pilin protein MshC